MKFLSILILSTTLSLSSASAHARNLRAAMFDIAPWGYRDSSGLISGIEYEIIRAISKEINEEIDISLVPYKRMIHQLKNGETDFGIFFKSQKSIESADALVRWKALDIIVIGLKGKKVNSYEDLRNYTVAVRLGGAFDERFDSDKKIRKHNQQDYTEAIKNLVRGKVDLVIGTAVTLAYELKKQNVDMNTLGEPFYINKKEDWLHFSRTSSMQYQTPRLKKAVKKLIANGTFDKIFEKYLPRKWNKDLQ